MAHLLNTLASKLRRAYADEKGSVLLELAFVTPIALSLFAGIMDLSLGIRARMKVNNLAYNMATIGAVNGRNIDEYQINDVLNNISDIVAPMADFPTAGKAIFAAVKGTSGTTGTILWNRCSGALDDGSQYAGAVGSTVTMPAGMTVGPGLTVMVASATYDYKPKFVNFVYKASSKKFTKVYVHRSRYGEYGATPTNLKVPAAAPRLCN